MNTEMDTRAAFFQNRWAIAFRFGDKQTYFHVRDNVWNRSAFGAVVYRSCDEAGLAIKRFSETTSSFSPRYRNDISPVSLEHALSLSSDVTFDVWLATPPADMEWQPPGLRYLEAQRD